MIKSRFRVALLGLAVLLIYLFLTFVATPPSGHYLTRDPEPLSREIAKFEVGYLSYLAGITAGALAAMLALLLSQKNAAPEYQEVARYGIIALLLGLALVTLGYASRNLWMATDRAFSPFFGTLDYWFFGPITALAYIVGLISLIELAILQTAKERKES